MGEEKKEKIVREFSSGGVVFKKSDNRALFLIAKSRPSKDYPEDVWRLPKGRLDDENFGLNPGPKARGEVKASEEDIQKTALREVREEGGVIAKIINKLGTEKFFYTSRQTKQKILKFVTFYLMAYQKDLKIKFLMESEKVEFLEFESAYKKLSYSGEKKMLKIAKDSLGV